MNALASDSSTKIIQNPQLRSINGQKASLKIGERVPTATGSYSSGVSSTTVSALVNTQFQYLDVGVNVDITPRVYDNGDIGLKISLDVSSVTNYVSIGGISEPEIGQRKIEHEIRLKDGEVNLLGGMFETQETKSISGIPGLSQIPVLKYLFSETSKETTNNEIVFALMPHIVRAREIVPLNRRTLDVGTANGIQLHSTRNHPARTGAKGQSASIVPRFCFSVGRGNQGLCSLRSAFRLYSRRRNLRSESNTVECRKCILRASAPAIRSRPSRSSERLQRRLPRPGRSDCRPFASGRHFSRGHGVYSIAAQGQRRSVRQRCSRHGHIYGKERWRLKADSRRCQCGSSRRPDAGNTGNRDERNRAVIAVRIFRILTGADVAAEVLRG